MKESVAPHTTHPFHAGRSGFNVRRRVVAGLAITLTGTFATFASAFLIYFVAYVARLGLRYINFDFFTEVPAVTGQSGGGAAPAIEGSLIMIGIAALIGIPLGMAVGIYLSEYGRDRLAYSVRFLVDTLTGIPTIIFGLFAWVLIDLPAQSFTGLGGGVALSIIMIPTVARTTEEVLRLVPRELREASIALGATESRTILRVVIPSALSGVITGILLALARVAGETAPLIIAAGYSTFFSTNILGPMSSLPVQVFTDTLQPFQQQQNEAYAGSLVLVLLIVLTSLAVRWATGGFRERVR